MATYTIFTDQMEEISKKINRIANKCKKAGFPFTFTSGDSYDKVVEIKDSEGNTSTYILHLTDIEVSCVFRYEGWTALGMVQRKDGIIQCYFRDPSLIKEYCTTDFHCDHCKKHVRRNSVVVLEHEGGDRKVVGTSCVKEFTCGLDGNLIAAFADLSYCLEHDSKKIVSLLDNDDIPDECEYTEFYEHIGLYAKRCESVLKVVECAASIIRSYGFKSSQCVDRDEVPTCAMIPDWVRDYDKRIIEEDKEEAKDAMNWILGLDEQEYMKSSYLFNLHQICLEDFCTSKYYGMLASLIPTYRKAIVTAKIDELKRVSQYVGSVGEKITKDVVVIKKFWFETQFGNSCVILMKDNEGNILKWLTSSSTSKIKEGDEVKVTGTIKSHDEYRGEKQTSLLRCKFSMKEEMVIPEIIHENSSDRALREFLEYCG